MNENEKQDGGCIGAPRWQVGDGCVQGANTGAGKGGGNGEVGETPKEECCFIMPVGANGGNPRDSQLVFRLDARKKDPSRYAGSIWKARRTAVEIIDGKECQRCTACHQLKTLDHYEIRMRKKVGKAVMARRKTCIECRKKHKNEDGMEDLRQRKRSAEWRIKNKDRAREQCNRNKRKVRAIVLSHYGSVCECCGESRQEFLAVDHINGNGAKHRKKIGKSSLYTWLIANNFPPGFRLLCHNCNMARGIYGYCPHEKEREALQKADRIIC